MKNKPFTEYGRIVEESTPTTVKEFTNNNKVPTVVSNHALVEMFAWDYLKDTNEAQGVFDSFYKPLSKEGARCKEALLDLDYNVKEYVQTLIDRMMDLSLPREAVRMTDEEKVADAVMHFTGVKI